jgi:2-keto-4-pentenoate hydratase
MSTSSVEVSALARELFQARANGAPVALPPSARDGGLSLDAAFAVEAELVRLRLDSGRQTVGRKVGFANKALWRVLKLQTLVWAHMYDDTVHYATNGVATLSIAGMVAPRIEPEVVFKLKGAPMGSDAAAVLEAVEWAALGFEIVDCPFPDWKFQPVDFVASFGLHAALIVGEPRAMQADDVERLAALTVRLAKDGELVEEGYGKNVLRNPALCLGELTSAIAARAGMDPLTAGELVSTGSMTAAHPIAAGHRWDVVSEGDVLGALALDVRE